MKINGKEIKLETQTILSGILKDQGFNLLKIAVMKNGDIVPKAEYDINNLKYVVAQLKKTISDNKSFSDLNEALDVHGILDFNHENLEFSLDIVYDILGEHLTLAVDILNSSPDLNSKDIAIFLDFLYIKIRSALATLNQCDIKIVLELFFEILLSANRWCNVETYFNDVFSDFFIHS